MSFAAGPPVSLVVTCSPVPSHPSTALLEKTLLSVWRYVDANVAQVILAHDAPRADASPKIQQAYQDYLRALSEVIPEATILEAERWGHTAGLLRMVYKHLETDALLCSPTRHAVCPADRHAGADRTSTNQ